MNIESIKEDFTHSRFYNPFFEGYESFDIKNVNSLNIKKIYCLGWKDLIILLLVAMILNFLTINKVVFFIIIFISGILFYSLEPMKSSNIKFYTLKIKFNDNKQVFIPIDSNIEISITEKNKYIEIISYMIKQNPKIKFCNMSNLNIYPINFQESEL